MPTQAQATKTESFSVVNPKAAGIDVGSKFHVVAIGQGKEHVREYGVYTQDLHQLADWLKAAGIETVAMESTGSYWRSLFVLLQEEGFAVLLVNGRYTKNVKGRKSDVLDCQWIQKLHSLGLLQGSFLPDAFTETIRQYARHRKSLVENASEYINKMQKALRLMNVRLDNVFSDITGQSGQAVVQAILEGERDAEKLADLANWRIKASREQIIKALQGEWREEYVFELRHCYELYQVFGQKIKECDQQIEQLLQGLIADNEKQQGEARLEYQTKKSKRLNKNDPDIDLPKLCFQLTGGVDLTEIAGVGRNTMLTLLSETGFDLKAFPSAKHFTAWLGLAPNTKISGGKVLSSRTPKRKNRLSEAFRQAANVIGRTKSTLSCFFHRIAYKKGRLAAITATARKLAVIVYHMLTKRKPFEYVPKEMYQDQIRKQQLKSLQRKINQLQIKPEEIAFASS